jgi:hypothetical protein
LDERVVADLDGGLAGLHEQSASLLFAQAAIGIRRYLEALDAKPMHMV